MMQNPVAKKSLGQHFLINKTVCQKIVELAQISLADAVMEIGPGPGALSELLFTLPWQKLLFLEKDSRFAQALKIYCREKCEVLEIDALSFDWKSLKGSWKILGNLPYNIASPLIWDLVSRTRALVKGVFMVQLEVAQRLCANPDSKAYGALSVWVQNFSVPKLEMKISPGSFRPPPKVHSGVVLISPLPSCDWPSKPEKLRTLLHVCFQSRRKQLGTIFSLHKMDYMLQALEALGISSTLRPENLSPHSYRLLASFIKE